VAVIASALSIQDPRERPPEKSDRADQVQAPFKDPDSDFITLLNIWHHYHGFMGEVEDQNKMRQFCREHFLSFPRMREWIFIHEQITVDPEGAKDPRGRGAREISLPFTLPSTNPSWSGFLSNIAVRRKRTSIRQPGAGSDDFPRLYPFSIKIARGSWRPRWSKPPGSLPGPPPESKAIGWSPWPAPLPVHLFRAPLGKESR